MAAPDVLLELPDEHREAFKAPLGPVVADAEDLLAEVSGPLLTVGDVVTYHLLEAGRRPDLAVVDGRTERTAVDERIAETVLTDAERIANPPATVTAGLVAAMADGLATDEPATVVVDGEEDLAVLPAVALVGDGASVVYGQPGEGMVHVRVDARVRERVAALCERLVGDHERYRRLLER